MKTACSAMATSIVALILVGCNTSSTGPETESALAREQALVAQRVDPPHLELVREVDMAAVHARIQGHRVRGVKSGDLPRSTEFDDGDLVELTPDGKARLYRVDQDKLAAAAQRAALIGADGPSSAETPSESPQREDAEAYEDDDFVPKGWSNGVDDRVARPLTTYPKTHSELSKIGFLSINRVDSTTGASQYLGNGSGVLIGRRLVLTVAHALAQPAVSGSYYRYDFVPRMDPGTYPWGLETGVGRFVSSAFLANNCQADYQHWVCPQLDWGVLLLRSNAWPSGSPGWMGFRSDSDATLASYTVRHNGYPTCGDASQPAGCVFMRAYGSTGRIKYFSHAGGANNWNQVARFDLSTSGGHSGGPLYANIGGSLYVLGINLAYLCHQCASAAEIDPVLGPSYPEYLKYPNLARRIDPPLFNTLANIRSLYP